jgi:hypothetical protein
MDEIITAIRRAIIDEEEAGDDINFKLWRRSEGETYTRGWIAVARQPPQSALRSTR